MVGTRPGDLLFRRVHASLDYLAAAAPKLRALGTGPGTLLLAAAAVFTVGVLVVRQGGLQLHRGLFTLLLVFGFLLGLVLTRVVTFWQRRRPGHNRWFEDLRAVIGIGAVAALGVHTFVEVLPGPEVVGFGNLGPEQALAGLVGFYFGSRS